MKFKMKKYNLLILILNFFILFCMCNCNSEKAPKAESHSMTGKPPPAIQSASVQAAVSVPNEEALIDTIFHLKEVIERSQYIHTQTNGERNLKVWVAEAPADRNGYYWIKAGEDNGTELVTHFNFKVYTSPLRILYYDVISDEDWTLDEWRKQQRR